MASIQGVYLALFGRPADPLGLAFFNQATNNGANLAAIGDLSASAEYQTRFTGQSSTQIITSIYRSLFNRDPDLAGLTFFATALANKTLNINNIAIAIFDGAQGSDVTIRDLKVSAANAFTSQLDTVAEINGYTGTAAAASGAAFIAGVTTTAPTEAQVSAAVVTATTQPTPPASNVLLTANPDNLVGTAGNDIFTGNLVGTNGNLVSFQSFDSINGGAGTDELIAVGIGSVTTTTTTLQNIEKVTVIGGTNGDTLDLTSTTGVTDLSLQAPVGAYNVTGIGAGIKSLSVANATGGNVSFTMQNAAISGTTDAVALNLQGVGTATVARTISIVPTSGTNGVETVNVATSGAASNVVLNTTGTTTMNVTGSSALTAVLGAATVTTFDASAATGAISVQVAAGSGVQTIKTGTGNDTVNLFNGASTYATTDAIDTGAGRDTVRLGAADLATTTARTNIVNAEVMSNADAIGAVTVKLSNFGSTVDGFALGATATGTTIDYTAPTAGTFSIGNIDQNGLTVTLQGSATATADTIAISSGSATNTTADDGGTIVGANIENVSVTALGASATYAAITLNGSVGASTKATFLGDQSIAVGAVADSGAVTGGLTAGTADASGMTGTAAVTLGLAAAGNVTGTANADRIGGSAGADVINAGAGADRIAGNAGIDLITTGTGADVVVLGNGGVLGGLTAANRDSVLDFTAGTGGDVLELNGNLTDQIASLTTFTTATGAYNIGGVVDANFGTNAVVNSFNIATTAGSSATSLDATLGGADALTGTNLLLAIGNGGAATLTGVADTVGFLTAYQNGNAYVYFYDNNNNTDITAAEIALVGVINNVAVGGLTAANYS